MSSLRRILLCVAVFVVFASAGTFAESYPSFSYDVGVGSGFSTHGNFAEIQAALNTHFRSWLTWRNSAFYRIESERDDYFGLDTSILAGYRFPLGDGMSLEPRAGVGYRVTSRMEHAPFGEGGVTFRASAFSVGVSAKYIMYNLIEPSYGNEFIYSVNASGRLRGTF